MGKNILFLAHSYNDVDWFLPLVTGLKETEGYEPLMFFLRDRKESGISRIHEHVMEDADISVKYIFSMFNPAARALYDFSAYCAARTGKVPFKKLVKSFSFHRALLKVFYIGIDRIFKKAPQWLFSAQKINRFIDKNEIAMTVVDYQYIKRNPPYNSMRAYATARIVSYCRGKGIPVFMMPHGGSNTLSVGKKEECDYIYRDTSGLAPEVDYNEDSHFYADVLGMNLECDKITRAGVIGEKTRVEVLGSIRYDYSWIRKIETISLHLTGNELKKNGFLIVYLTTPFALPEVEKRNHEDIIGIIKEFPQTEMWVKHHPRNPWLFGIDGRIPSEVSARLREFRNEIDTNTLFHYADLVISPGSSMISQAIICGKPAIVYDWWKKHINFTGETVFENAPCVWKAKTPGELYESCRQIMDGARPKDEDIKEYYKTRISSGSGLHESIVPRYIDVVRRFSK